VRATVLGVVVPLALWGCGASGMTTVATVQGRSIGKDAVAHWMGIKRAEGSSAATPSSADQLKHQALAFLITADWLEGEAAAAGITVSDAEIGASYRRLLQARTGQAFAESLRRRGMSSADELRVLRLGAIAQRLRAKIKAHGSTPSAARGQAGISEFLTAYRQRWKQRTKCSPGYVIAECSNGPPL
jgi:hypothetical protein